MSHLSDIVMATRRSAAALKRAQAWNRAAMQAEREMDAHDRAGNLAGAEAAHSRMMQALRLREQNLGRHEKACAFLNPSHL